MAMPSLTATVATTIVKIEIAEIQPVCQNLGSHLIPNADLPLFVAKRVPVCGLFEMRVQNRVHECEGGSGIKKMIWTFVDVELCVNNLVFILLWVSCKSNV